MLFHGTPPSLGPLVSLAVRRTPCFVDSAPVVSSIRVLFVRSKWPSLRVCASIRSILLSIEGLLGARRTIVIDHWGVSGRTTMQSANDEQRNAGLNGFLILAMALGSWGLVYLTATGVWAMASVWFRQAGLDLAVQGQLVP
jgi:hypothetical protein